MSVQQLNENQLDCLRWALYYDDNFNGDVDYPGDITDEMLFSYYGGINFVSEDFAI